MKAYRAHGIRCVAVVFVLVLLLPRAAAAEAFSFLDNFNDGDISDWTVQTSGTGSIGASMVRSFEGICGLHTITVRPIGITSRCRAREFPNRQRCRSWRWALACPFVGDEGGKGWRS